MKLAFCFNMEERTDPTWCYSMLPDIPAIKYLAWQCCLVVPSKGSNRRDNVHDVEGVVDSLVSGWPLLLLTKVSGKFDTVASVRRSGQGCRKCQCQSHMRRNDFMTGRGRRYLHV